MFLFSLGHALEHYAMGRARRAIEALAELAPETARVRRDGQVQEIPIAELNIGDLVIVGIPGEMAAGLGLDIKRETALATEAAHPVIGGLADEWISYMLTPDEYAKGGYEASVSFYGPKLGPTIVEGALGLELEAGDVIADEVDGRRCIFLAGLHRSERDDHDGGRARLGWLLPLDHHRRRRFADHQLLR